MPFAVPPHKLPDARLWVNLKLPLAYAGDAAAKAAHESFACGPDVERHVEVFKPFAEAGFDHLALINAGPDMDAFFDFFESELGPALREVGG